MSYHSLPVVRKRPLVSTIIRYELYEWRTFSCAKAIGTRVVVKRSLRISVTIAALSLHLTGCPSLALAPTPLNDAASVRCMSKVAEPLELLKGGKALEAYPDLLQLHKEGCINATRLLGVMYTKGDGVDRDLDKAETYLAAASDAGDSEASFVQALLQTTRESHFGAMLKAAEQGHLLAAQQVGLYYLRGEGVTVNKLKAFRWLFSVRIRTVIISEATNVPLAKLEAELNEKEKEQERVAAWNLVYIDTRTGWFQSKFDADNPNLAGRITVENYEVVDGHLIVH